MPPATSERGVYDVRTVLVRLSLLTAPHLKPKKNRGSTSNLIQVDGSANLSGVAAQCLDAELVQHLTTASATNAITVSADERGERKGLRNVQLLSLL